MRTLLLIVPLALAFSACKEHHSTRAEAESEIEAAGAAAILTPESHGRTFKVAVRVLVRDQATGAPVAGAIIDDLGYLGRSTGDDGVYTGTALIMETQGSFSVRCRGRGLTAGEVLGEPRYGVHEGRIDIVVEVDAGRCGPPPLKRRARYAGMYVPEFESRAFFPCEGLPAASTQHSDMRSGVWANVPDEIENGLIRARMRERMLSENDGFYVEWTGTLTGPGDYGHLGMSLYELDVEAIHDTSNHRPGSCKAPGYADSLEAKADRSIKEQMQTQG